MTAAWQRALLWSCLAITVAGFFYICAFKILDRDFWWHIKAGEIMVNTYSLIHTEPFAYTRAGQPYLSSHHWLAEIVFYKVWRAGGPTGEIMLRTLLVAAAFVVILCIDPRRVWPNFFLILAAAYTNRPSFMDRPQLFTFVFFALFVWAAFYYLRKAAADSAPWQRNFASWRWRLLAALAIILVLWVNMHGAAATYGIIIVGALMVARGAEWLGNSSAESRSKSGRELQYLALLLIVLGAAAFISPHGWRTFHDVFIYTHDPTLALVREWQPRGAGSYSVELGPYWLLAALALFVGRRQLVFNGILLAIFGYFSFQSYRHGLPFILTTLGITMYQLAAAPAWQQWLKRVERKPLWLGAGSLALLALMAGYARYHDISEVAREGYSGYGTAAVAEDAYNFLERRNVSGRMFNTYAIGDYLLYRGYPNRLVYVDGRNIDHGYDLLYRTSVAGFDPAMWDVLEEQYQFTYAVIEYPLSPGASAENDLPYVAHLAHNANWPLVYLDDKVAVYLKRTAENAALIKELAYKVVTPPDVEFGRVFADLPPADMPAAEQELRRMAADSARGIKANLLLAHHFSEVGKYEEAERAADAAAAAQPYRPEVFEALGVIAADTQEWAKAGALFEKSLALTGGVGLPINYNYLAEVFSKAGNSRKAAEYARKAQSQ